MTKKSFWDNSSLQQDIKWDNQELPGCPDEVLLTKNWERSDWVKKNNLKTYGNQVYILRSPGNDLLDFYDQQNKLLGSDNRAYSAIPPSVVYHYRFEHRYPDELFDKSKNYGQYAYLRDQLKNYYQTNDHTYWAQVFKRRYDWLVDNPHTEYRFNIKADLNKFIVEKFNQKCISQKISMISSTNKLKTERLETMFWRGEIKGWSIVVEK